MPKLRSWMSQKKGKTMYSTRIWYQFQYVSDFKLIHTEFTNILLFISDVQWSEVSKFERSFARLLSLSLIKVKAKLMFLWWAPPGLNFLPAHTLCSRKETPYLLTYDDNDERTDGGLIRRNLLCLRFAAAVSCFVRRSEQKSESCLDREEMISLAFIAQRYVAKQGINGSDCSDDWCSEEWYAGCVLLG